MRLKGRKAVVTGGSRGMGRQFGQALAAEGAVVALLARQSDALTTAAAEIDGAFAVPCDLRDNAQVGAAIDRAGELLCGIDIVVNDAGLMLVNRVEDLRDDEIEDQIAVNFAGPIYVCRAAIPWLRKSASPDIVNVSSSSVKAPIPFISIYGATKTALEYFTHALRDELRPDLIRVALLRSGFVADTEINRHIGDEAKLAAFVEVVQISGQRYRSGSTGASPEGMAEGLVSFLALPRELNLDIVEMRPTAP
jgi:NAD(P)-dependent dehydrogenase (short-subunit alcohol dehydrogenase family)